MPEISGKSLLKWLFLRLIRIYQVVLSPILGRNCRFSPTCSHYATEAIEKYGPFKGGALAVKRIMRCHPWAKGGIDPVP